MKNRLSHQLLIVGALLASCGAGSVLAQDIAMPAVDQAQQELDLRIREGVQSGRISQAEAQNLSRGMRQIERREADLKRAGFASPDDRQQLRQQLEAMRSDVEAMLNRPRSVQPGNNTPGIDDKNRVVREMIDSGLRSRVFSRQEARELQRRRGRIEQRAARFKASGVVTQDQRQQLRDELDDLKDDVEDLRTKRMSSRR